MSNVTAKDVVMTAVVGYCLVQSIRGLAKLAHETAIYVDEKIDEWAVKKTETTE